MKLKENGHIPSQEISKSTEAGERWNQKPKGLQRL